MFDQQLDAAESIAETPEGDEAVYLAAAYCGAAVTDFARGVWDGKRFVALFAGRDVRGDVNGGLIKLPGKQVMWREFDYTQTDIRPGDTLGISYTP